MRKLLFVLLFAIAGTPLYADHFADGGDGVRIWYTEVGKGSPVIVVHGGPGMDHLTLEADLAPLEKHHRVIYYDQRGGGRSTLPANPALLTIDHHVADLEALRQSLWLDRDTLVPHSFGPRIAAPYGIRYPEHVDRMVLLARIPPRTGDVFVELRANLGHR